MEHSPAWQELTIQILLRSIILFLLLDDDVNDVSYPCHKQIGQILLKTVVRWMHVALS